jgi:molecular chaperone HtpG
MAEKQTHGFQTEVKQLLDLMIHSLYSNKEIFLRELISNASDACDKLRFEALSNEALYEGDGELAIEVSVDPEGGTLTVRDNGTGMNEQSVIDNLGTIARSGTRQFFESLTGDEAQDARLIGQFGVGFYASFIVADRVTVVSRAAGSIPEGGVRWESDGQGEFTVQPETVEQRGTAVTLHLKDDAKEFADAFRIRGIIKKYSEHVSFPIRMLGQGEDPIMETVNSATALWTRSKSEIGDEEYGEFYKHVSHDFADPLCWVHSRVEGNLDYTSLLYIPANAPFDLWDRQSRRGVSLYVKRVFIMDDAEKLLPGYLRFVRGVIDCADLPLNVSREILQQSRQIDSIRAGSVKKILDMIASLAKNDEDKFKTFWREFGRVMKEGVVDDTKNRDAIAALLRFASTKGEGEEPSVSLADYVARMKEGQERIYYITADRYATARNSPHLEIFTSRDIEVLLLTDEIDEWMVHSLPEFEGKKLYSVAKGDPGLEDLSGEEDETQADAATDGDHEALLAKLREALGERVKDVRVSRRLTSSPACLVVEEHDMSGHLERLLRASGQTIQGARPILEVNPAHVVVKHLDANDDPEQAAEWAGILYDQALLSEGGRLDDPAGFVRRMNEMILSVAGRDAA